MTEDEFIYLFRLVRIVTGQFIRDRVFTPDTVRELEHKIGELFAEARTQWGTYSRHLPEPGLGGFYRRGGDDGA